MGRILKMVLMRYHEPNHNETTLSPEAVDSQSAENLDPVVENYVKPEDPTSEPIGRET